MPNVNFQFNCSYWDLPPTASVIVNESTHPIYMTANTANENLSMTSASSWLESGFKWISDFSPAPFSLALLSSMLFSLCRIFFKHMAILCKHAGALNSSGWWCNQMMAIVRTIAKEANANVTVRKTTEIKAVISELKTEKYNSILCIFNYTDLSNAHFFFKCLSF